MTGISYVTNYLAARQRWCKSHSMRSKVIAHVVEEIGIRKTQDITVDLKESVIKMRSQQMNTSAEKTQRILRQRRSRQMNTSAEKISAEKTNFDSSSLPPCRAELQPHIRRTAYIVKLWTNAHSKTQVELDATTCGWSLSDDGKNLEFLWYDGNQLPATISDITGLCEKKKSQTTKTEMKLRNTVLRMMIMMLAKTIMMKYIKIY